MVRSQRGAVALDLDGDGDEGTGWVLLYHWRSEERVAVSTWVEADAPLGHPSCEGGVSTGTHLHIARKYNGEWIRRKARFRLYWTAGRLMPGYPATTAVEFDSEFSRDGCLQRHRDSLKSGGTLNRTTGLFSPVVAFPSSSLINP